MRKLIIILLLFFSLGGFCQSQYTNWFTVLSDSTQFPRGLPSNTLVHLLDSNKIYQLQASFPAYSYMAQVFASGNYREVPGSFASLGIDTLYISDSIYDLRVEDNYFYFNDTVYGIATLQDSIPMGGDTTGEMLYWSEDSSRYIPSYGAKFRWDAANSRLAIGKYSPSYTLDVSGTKVKVSLAPRQIATMRIV